MTEFLTIDDAARVISRFGFHVRDAGLLTSALARPSASLFGTDAYPTLDEKAAALLESLARNRPLVDGNKRTAWTLTVLFLWINGFQHDFDTDAAFDLVVGVASGAVSLAMSAPEIRAHRLTRPV